MPERTFELHPVGVEYVCEECQIGVMVARDGGIMLLSDPPQHPHACTNCGHQRSFASAYPTVRYERAADPKG